MANILNISGTKIKDTGIQKLAEYVEANLTDEFTLVLGCKPAVYDVDAILIGGGSIYAIECKDWKGTIKGGSYGWWQKDGQVIENPLQQARNNAVALGKWLREKLKDINGSVWVKGLIVFTHEDVEYEIDIDDKSISNIYIISIDSLKEHISSENASISDKTENILVNYFMNLIKPLKIIFYKKIKLLRFITLITLTSAIISGYFFITGDRNSISAIILALSGITLVVITGLWNDIWRFNKTYSDIQSDPLEGYNMFSDYTKDIYNVFGTYDKKTIIKDYL
ncbi:MAG: hypothetical protein AMK70_04505 [Nitrospira bacterium SG8_35_1]|nr:MAG: hypothetical protein AMK70_04505 [Nitrospira bacterium SG8_35_1]